MEFEFENDELRALFATGSHPCLHPNLVKAFFRVMQIITDASDERVLRGFKGLHMEKLKGERQYEYSLRLNDQFRLIFQIEQDMDGSNYLLISAIEDYH